MLLQRLLSIMMVSATLILYMFLSLQSRQIDQLQHTEYGMVQVRLTNKHP